MFDHEGVKTMKIFKSSFCMSTLKSWSLKKYEVIGPSMPNQFMAQSIYGFSKSTLQFS